MTWGVNCAGIMPIMTYGGFKRMTSFCKTAIPSEISEHLEKIKDNDEAVKAYGIELGTQMCRRLLEAGTPGLHMYTLNLENASVSILQNLGLIEKSQVGHPPSHSALLAGHPSLGVKLPHRALSGAGVGHRPGPN